MAVSKEELKSKIEEARDRLNFSIDRKQDYKSIYQISVELDQLIVNYMEAGY